jgi:hypothetical protein
MRFVLLVMAVLAAACSGGSTGPTSDGLLALGTWGGENSGMIVGDTAVHVHVGCTYGDISGRVRLSEGGQFDVAGSYLLRAFPIAVGPTMPARFVGRVDGSRATVSVTVNDTVEHKSVALGPVVVTLGTEAHMGPCPICRRPVLTKRVGFWGKVWAAARWHQRF